MTVKGVMCVVCARVRVCACARARAYVRVRAVHACVRACAEIEWSPSRRGPSSPIRRTSKSLMASSIGNVPNRHHRHNDRPVVFLMPHDFLMIAERSRDGVHDPPMTFDEAVIFLSMILRIPVVLMF